MWVLFMSRDCVRGGACVGTADEGGYGPAMSLSRMPLFFFRLSLINAFYETIKKVKFSFKVLMVFFCLSSFLLFFSPLILPVCRLSSSPLFACYVGFPSTLLWLREPLCPFSSLSLISLSIDSISYFPPTSSSWSSSSSLSFS